MKTSHFKLLAAAGVALMMLAACNTVAGIGRDIRSLGGAMEDSAEENGAQKARLAGGPKN